MVLLVDHRMRVCWMLLVLLGCRFSHANQALSSSCNDELQTVRAVSGDSASVPCPLSVDAVDVTFDLLRGTEVISKHKCVLTGGRPSCSLKNATGRPDAELQQNSDNATLSFALAALSVGHSAIYRCEATITFPPPHITLRNSSSVLLLVEGPQCEQGEPGAVEGRTHWAWIVGLVALSIYCVIVTFIAFMCRRRIRRIECQSDYMNTKPRAPRGRRKGTVLQPLHF
ncbi:uncharacterized protein LOC143012360 [Genypterus blacodes]|uniref:uncharacterized protein LOC143012360 n=1 Tax=Genypterus blacodes TaxID=154954 RepID=UPI003F7678A7